MESAEGMKALLDTNALLWLSFAPEELGKRALAIIERARADASLSVSAVSFWEAALLRDKGKLHLDVPPLIWRRGVLDLGISEIPLDGAIGVRAVQLADLPSDPADRFIVATAEREDATLITGDRRILEWQGQLSRQDARR
jgi:PIN domain nuclease of toxin-antitoxin system